VCTDCGGRVRSDQKLMRLEIVKISCNEWINAKWKAYAFLTEF